MKYNAYKKIRALVLIATIAFFAVSAINGMVGLFDSISATAASAASARMDNDVMLNIEYRLKNDEGLQKAGDVVAYQQFALREAKGADLSLSENEAKALKAVKLTDKKKEPLLTCR